MLSILAAITRSRKGSGSESEMIGGRRPKPKCRSLICISIVATLFFAIGVFQTFLGIFYARAASRNPILILGPVFAGIGLILYMALFDMCLQKFRRPKVADRLASDALEEQSYPEQLKAIDLQLENSKFPPIFLLTQDDLVQVGPEDVKKMLQEHEESENKNPSAPPVDTSSDGPRGSCSTTDEGNKNNTGSETTEGKDISNAENSEEQNAEMPESSTKAKEDPDDLLQLLGEVKGVCVTE